MTECEEAAPPSDDGYSCRRIKLKQVSESYIMQQQTHNNFQSVRSHSPASAILAKGSLTSDEFKFGFPSTGLSAVSYKWWESSSLNDIKTSTKVNTEVREPKSGSKELEIEQTPPEITQETASNSPNPDCLTAIRKRAVEEGRESLKPCVCKPDAIQKPTSKQTKLLRKIFGTSLPRQWLDISNIK